MSSRSGRPSTAMLPPGTAGTNRDETLVLLDQLRDAFWEVRALRRRVG
jgi:hypothetical protein